MPLISISFLLAIQPQDFWWLMQVGRETIQNGNVPITDTISWSQAGQPIVYQQWLAGAVFYFFYNIGGITLIFLLRGFLITITYGVLWWMIRKVSNPILASTLIFILGISTANNWAVRSQLLVYPLFAICLWILLDWQNGNKKYLWLLPVSMLLWINLHGSFILLFVLSISALIFGNGDKKNLLITIIITFLVTFINPHTFNIWNYFVFMMNSPSDHLFAFEWAPPTNAGWQMNIFFAWFILFAPLAKYSNHKLTRLEWVWFLGFAWLALTGLRYVIWFHFILAIFSGALLSEFVKKINEPQKTFPQLNTSFGIFMLIIPLMFLTGLREKWMGDSVPVYEMSTTPLSSTLWLIQNPQHCDNLWADYAFGGYLPFAFPSCKPWMDSRFNAYPPQQWTEYVQITNADENWQQFFDDKNIENLFLSQAAQPKLIQAVSESDIWCEQYRDDYAVIFSRCELTP